MNHRTFLRLLPIAGVALLSLSAHAAGIKPGLWSVQVTQQTMDGQDMKAKMQAAHAQMEQAMKNMPPAQRKQMEQMMGARTQPDGATQVCISPAMASMDKPPMPPKGMQCDTQKISHSGNTMSYEISCKDARHSMQGKGQSSYGGDWVKNQTDMTTEDASHGGGKHHMQMASEMHFVSSDCGGVKPMEEIAKQIEANTAAQH